MTRYSFCPQIDESDHGLCELHSKKTKQNKKIIIITETFCNIRGLQNKRGDPKYFGISVLSSKYIYRGGHDLNTSFVYDSDFKNG